MTFPDGARAWQRMLSGRRLDLLNPSPLDIELEDIAHGLARVARWNGQTSGDHSFSVAQHSLFVCVLLDNAVLDAAPALRLGALLHDAPEYVIGDMISPFKAAIGDAYRAVENRLLASIRLRFGLAAQACVKEEQHIKRADRQAAFYEAVHLAGFSRAEGMKIFGRPAPVSAGLLEEALIPLAPSEAQRRFTLHIRRLLEEIEGVHKLHKSPGAV
jgi:uncharacterized protein